ncbi:MAG: hypothetical protein AABX03_00580 [Nanoarchaeota archaeon]
MVKSTTELLCEIDPQLRDPNNREPRLGSWTGSIDAYASNMAHYLAEETETALYEIRNERFIG